MRKALTVAAMLLGMTACVAPGRLHLAQNETRLSFIPKPEDVDVVGPVNAEGQNDYLFCLIPIQEDGSVNRLVQSMRQSVRADAIVNLSVESRVHWLLFYCWNQVSVSGLAVRFKRYKNVDPRDVSEKPSPNAARLVPGPDSSELFAGMKPGQHVRLTMPDSPPTEYVFLQYHPSERSISIKPVGGGWFSEKAYYLQYILEAEPLDSDIMPPQPEKGRLEQVGSVPGGLPGFSVSTTSPTLSAEPRK